MDKVVHFHLPVNDMNRAKKFYTDIFGWEINEIDEYKDYQLVTTVATYENNIPVEPGAINGSLYVRETPEEYPEITIEVSSMPEVPHSEDFRECVALKAHHLDMEFYDKFYKPGAYLKTHAAHMARWHSHGSTDF